MEQRQRAAMRLLAPARQDAESDRWLLDCLALVAETRRALHAPPENDGPQPVFEIARTAARRILSFPMIAFMTLAEDGLDFELVDCDPPPDREVLQAEVDRCVRRGDFGHALRGAGPVIRPTTDGRTLVLHPLPGHGGVQAMFVGILDDPDPLLPEVPSQVLSVLLAECGAALESNALRRTLLRHNEILERLVDERTRELQESEQELRNAGKAKDEFVANMSHELRTPLNGVVGATRLLLDTELPEEQRELAEVVDQSARLLTEMVNDLLALCETATSPTRRSAVDLRSLIDQVVAAMRPHAAEKHLDLTLDVAGLPLRVGLDGNAIRDALSRLLHNALKFTERGAIRVRARGWPEEGGAHVRIEVSDTGIGITPADCQRIFDRFVQADGSATRRFGGAGIGLALCRETVERLGGRIGVDSEEGVGSTFWISLPMPVVAWSQDDGGGPEGQGRGA